MKHPLVIGLGNPLAGDDGIGWHLAERLRDDPRLPAHTDVLQGADLLRLEDELADRPLVVLLDALLDDGEPGRVLRFDELEGLDDHGGSVHHLPPAQALRLLRCLYPALRSVPVLFLGVTIHDVKMGTGLSPSLHDRVAPILEEVLAELSAHAHAA